jgi:hypothetical protein
LIEELISGLQVSESAQENIGLVKEKIREPYSRVFHNEVLPVLLRSPGIVRIMK